MKLSVFWDHLLQAANLHETPLPEMLRAVRRMGYDMVEMDFDTIAADPSIVSLLQGEGMEISSIYCFFEFEKSRQADRIESLIQAALRTGARRIMPIPGFYHGEDASYRADEFARMLSGMERLTGLAEKAGLTVTIEDFDSAASPIRDSAGMRQFLDRLPALRVTFDTGNFRFCGEEELSAFDALADRIAHVHLKDRALTDEYGGNCLTALSGTPLYPCPVGSGVIPIDRILTRLKGIGYDGVLTAEHFGCRDPLTAMQASAEFITRTAQDR